MTQTKTKTAGKTATKTPDQTPPGGAALKTPQADANAAPAALPQTLEAAQALMGRRRADAHAARDAYYAEQSGYSEARGKTLAAVRTADYAEAARLKELGNKHESEMARLREALKAAHTLRSEALAQVEALYFARFGDKHFQEQLTVSRIVVADPATGQTDSATYFDSGATVLLRLGDERHQQFESEAYHVSEWAAEHGYLTKTFSVEVSI